MVFYPYFVLHVAALLAVTLQGNAHVFVGDPSPVQWGIDIDQLIMPMNGDPNHHGAEWGQQEYPCKGHHTRAAQKEPQTIWYAGEEVTFRIFDSTNTSGASMHEPGAAHSGGSCQLSLSYDKGLRWNVVQSWIGNCVRVKKGSEGQLTNSYDLDQNYTFRLPGTLPSSDYVLIAWTWLNASGNREFYMSCSTVKVKGSREMDQQPIEYPMMIANLRANPTVNENEDWIWSRCNIPHGVWVRYPQRYIGMNTPIIAPAPTSGSPIEFWDFEDHDGFCSSENSKLVKALAFHGNTVPLSTASSSNSSTYHTKTRLLSSLSSCYDGSDTRIMPTSRSNSLLAPP